jgi:hypothetical protein
MGLFWQSAITKLYVLEQGEVLWGFGLLNLIFGGMVFFSRARTALMQDVMPDAPSEWPCSKARSVISLFNASLGWTSK